MRYDESDCNGAYPPFTRGRKAKNIGLQTRPIYVINVKYCVVIKVVMT